MVTVWVLWVFVGGFGSARIDVYQTEKACQETGVRIGETLRDQGAGPVIYMCVSRDEQGPK